MWNQVATDHASYHLCVCVWNQQPKACPLHANHNVSVSNFFVGSRHIIVVNELPFALAVQMLRGDSVILLTHHSWSPSANLSVRFIPTSSTKKSVPISLLIMSRAFTLQAPDPARALAQSISAMDEDVVTEVSSTIVGNLVVESIICLMVNGNGMSWCVTLGWQKKVFAYIALGCLGICRRSRRWWVVQCLGECWRHVRIAISERCLFVGVGDDWGCVEWGAKNGRVPHEEAGVFGETKWADRGGKSEERGGEDGQSLEWMTS